jgi:hypothetical protein
MTVWSLQGIALLHGFASHKLQTHLIDDSSTSSTTSSIDGRGMVYYKTARVSAATISRLIVLSAPLGTLLIRNCSYSCKLLHLHCKKNSLGSFFSVIIFQKFPSHGTFRNSLVPLVVPVKGESSWEKVFHTSRCLVVVVVVG